MQNMRSTSVTSKQTRLWKINMGETRLWKINMGENTNMFAKPREQIW